MAALAVMACSDGEGGEADGAGAARPPDLILIVVDTLRADHVSAYGYPRPTTPTLDRLAGEGTRFANAFAASSWTRPSVASLFTSRRPSEHGAVRSDLALDESKPTLAETLRRAGYLTVGVSANFVHVAGHSGLSRGFEVWSSASVPVEEGDVEVLWAPRDAEGRPVARRPRRAPRADELNREVLERVPAERQRPLFLYVHYMEPHSPYAPPEEQRKAFARASSQGRPAAVWNERLVELAGGEIPVDEGERDWIVDLYDAEVAAADAAIGSLLHALAGRGLAEEAIVAVTSDHGEELGDHGGWFHVRTLYDEVLRVPLVLRGPGVPAGAVEEAAVDLLDLPTTLLALAGVAVPSQMRGRVLLHGDLPERALVAELHPDPVLEDTLGRQRHRIAVLQWPWKALVDRDGARGAFRLDRDAGERDPRPLDAAPAPLAAQLHEAARMHLEIEAPERALDPEELESLRALGYAR